MATFAIVWKFPVWTAVLGGAFCLLLLTLFFRTNRVELEWRQNGWSATLRASVLVGAVRIPLFRNKLPGTRTPAGPKRSGEKPAGDPEAGVRRPTTYSGRRRTGLRSASRSLTIARETIRRVERLEVDAKLGLDDAMLSSLAVGACWTAAGIALPVVQSEIAFSSPPRIRLTPLYNRTAVEVDAVCIFHIRLGDIVWESVKRAWTQRSGKEGRPVGKPAASH